jgi:hypothetical protein
VTRIYLPEYLNHDGNFVDAGHGEEIVRFVGNFGAGLDVASIDADGPGEAASQLGDTELEAVEAFGVYVLGRTGVNREQTRGCSQRPSEKVGHESYLFRRRESG